MFKPILEVLEDRIMPSGISVLPPEINSARMYAGSGSGPLLAAAAAWDSLAAELSSAAASFGSITTGLAGGAWSGPASEAMAAASAPYVAWLSASSIAATEGQYTEMWAQDAAAMSVYAAASFEAAFATTVPPPAIAANRAELMSLVATNFFGQNTPAIAATEAQYMEMWAQDVASLAGYID